jgi:hypothetical protein
MSKQLHHIVPRFYLRQFVDPRQRPRELLWVYERGKSEPKLLPVDAVAARKNYYTVERRQGRSSRVVEEQFAKIESLAAPVFRAIRQNPSKLSMEEKGIFAFFISFQFGRVPKFRDEVEQTATALLQRDMRETASNPSQFSASVRAALGQELEPEEIEDLRRLVLNGDVEPVAAPGLSLSYMLRAALDLLCLLKAMQWAFREAHPSVALVSSDSPLILNNPSLLPGHGPPSPRELEITFPVSPEVLFIATWDGHAGTGRMNPFLTRQVNRLIAIASERFVYSPEKIVALAKYLQAPPKKLMPDADAIWQGIRASS